MKAFRDFFFFSICLFVFTNCSAQEKRDTKQVLRMPDVTQPVTISSNVESALFIGVDENSKLFFFTGDDSQQYTVIDFSALDTVIRVHKSKFPNASFVLKECEGAKISEVKKIIDSLKALGIARFSLDNSEPCHALNGKVIEASPGKTQHK